LIDLKVVFFNLKNQLKNFNTPQLTNDFSLLDLNDEMKNRQNSISNNELVNEETKKVNNSLDNLVENFNL
jgi:hypothetical protein